MKQLLQNYPRTAPARAAAVRGAKLLHEAASAHLRGRLLDIGCGSGLRKSVVAEFIDEYVGLDHADSQHDVSNVDIVGTAYEIPEPDQSYDSVLCTSVLEHLEEPAAALREAHRVLRPGGVAVYTVPMFWHLHEQPRDFYRYTRYGLEHLFRQAGFEIVEMVPLSGFWLTMATEFNYYAVTTSPRLLRPLVRLLVGASNLFIERLDAFERRRNPASAWWTCAHVVVARKPE